MLIVTMDAQKWNNYAIEVGAEFDFVGEFSIESKMIEVETTELQHQKLQQILSGLSKRQREVVYLKFYQEMDYQQIATMMSINYQSVRNLVHSAIKDLQTAWLAS